MKKDKNPSLDTAALRRQAEKRLKEGKKEAVPHLTQDETQRLVHELQVHQIELEVQNEELRHSRADVEAGLERYTTLYDFAPVGYLTLDCDGSIRQVNLTGARLLGVERAMLMGRRFGHFVAEGDRPVLNAFLQKVFESRIKQACEVALPKEGGQSRWVNIEAIATEDGKECYGVVSDISEHKRFDDAQLFLVKCGWSASGEAFFEALARYLAESLGMDFVCIDRLVGDGLNAQTVAVYFDGKFEDNIEYALKDTPCGDVVGHTICCFPRDVRRLFPKDAVLQDMAAESYVGTTLWGSKGQPIGLIAVIGRHPLTDPRLAESMLKLVSIRAAGELERRQAEDHIKELNEKLNSQVVQMDAANKELESFSYSVSHDLHAPLRHLLGFTKMLQEKYEIELDEQGRHYTATISSAAKKMQMIIDDLLAFSRMGRVEMRVGNVKFDTLAREAVRAIQHEVKGRDITWEIDHLPDVYGDKSMLSHVLTNLISNAIKFTRTRQRAEIKIGCEADENEFVFFVKDNGVGFDMKSADRLFEVFQRLHTQDEFEGTGIGLANVRRIISRHRGRIWAEGTEGQGAIFYFTIPKTKEL